MTKELQMTHLRLRTGRILKVPRERARSLPLPVRDERGEGWGEGFVHEVSTQVGRPCSWPSPHSFVVGRENSFRQQWWYCPDAPPRTRCSVRATSFVICHSCSSCSPWRSRRRRSPRVPPTRRTNPR